MPETMIAQLRSRADGIFRRFLSRVRLDDDGMVPLAQAAALMGLDAGEVESMARRRMLEAEVRADGLYVRPAAVSVLGLHGGPEC
jgi:hypothetical protein